MSAFMVPEIEQGDWLVVETESHDEVLHPVAFTLTDLPKPMQAILKKDGEIDSYISDELKKALLPFLEGNKVGKIRLACGWFARLSAPGYLDATDWDGPYESEDQARYELAAAHDVCGLCGEDLDDGASSWQCTSCVEGTES